MKFAIGDMVRYIANDAGYAGLGNKTARVVAADRRNEPYPYLIRFDFQRTEWPVKEEELESA